MPGTLPCPARGTENPAEFTFCGHCAAALSGRVCAACAAPLSPRQLFCGRCGTPVAGGAPESASLPDPAVGGERRLATVLFADVVGFTTLADGTDHEVVAATVADAFAGLAGIVRDHGGTVDKYMGDSLMAIFGLPSAHDDDAERAVAAALAIRDAGGELTFSIGVNTGEVMAMTMPGEGRVTVIGDTVNVAARLEKAAGAGEVLIGALTARLAGDRVVLHEREALLLKGKREAVHVFQAVGLRDEHAVRSGPHDRMAVRPPLVGRDAELAFLMSRWRRCVQERQAEMVILVGEVGTGKSRLLEELAARAGDEALRVGVTYPAYGALSGARATAELLRHLGSTSDVHLDALLASVAGTAQPQLAGLDADAMDREQLRAVRRLLELRAAERPLLLAMDEAQRASERTLRFLGELSARVEGPVLMLLAGRPEPADWLTRHPHATRVRVDPLSPSDAATLASALVSEGCLDADAALHLATRSSGNPLHLRELVGLVRERQGLVPTPHGLELRGGLTLPPSLHAVLTARLDALPPSQKSAIQHVALLGDGATPEALRTVGMGASDADLDHLIAGGLIRHRDDGHLEVMDPLLRDVAYELLPRQVRADLHRRAAGTATMVDERARHLEQALEHRPADPELRAATSVAVAAAGMGLVELHRPGDAVALLRRAVELGARDPAVLLALGQELVGVGCDAEALEVLDLLPDTLEGAEAAERVHVRANALTRRNPAQAVEGYTQARALWAVLGNRGKEAWAVANAAVALTFQGRLGEASRLMRKALELFSEVDDRTGLTSARQLLGLLHPEDPEVERWMREGLEWARAVGDPSRERYALQNLTWYHFLRAQLGGAEDVSTALEHALELARAGRELGDLTICVQGHASAAILLRMAGDLAGCVEHAHVAAALDIDAGGVEQLRRAAVFVAGLLDDPALGWPEGIEEPADAIGLIASLSALESIALAGRHDELVTLLRRVSSSSFDMPGAQQVGLALLVALIDISCGDAAAAASRLTAVVPLATAMRAGPVAAAAHALLAEATARGGDVAGARDLLASLPTPLPGGVAGALVLRPAAFLGDEDARRRLRAEGARLRAPALLEPDLGPPAALL